MNLEQAKASYSQYIAPTYGRYDLLALRGTGATLAGAGDRHYIDFGAGIGVNSLGFCAPGWVEAVKDQVDALAHVSNLYYTEPQVRVAEALCRRTGMKRVFFGNSGAEANEGAIKTARKYGADRYGPERCEIITLQNSFHGRTIATLAATGQDAFHKNFGPFPAGFVYAQANNVADLESKVSERTCAIMLECIQGEGGVVPLEQDFADAVARICGERDILLVVDEVQTGVGRTGKFLCAEHLGLRPDLVTLAKGLGGGLPIGAVLFGEKVQDILGPGDHGSTFGGNPISCAGALAVLEALDDAFLQEVCAKGDALRQALEALPGVLSVTGRGLMLGVALPEGLAANDVVRACADAGLVVLTAKSKVRLLPPLNISREDIGQGVAILGKVLGQLEEGQKR